MVTFSKTQHAVDRRIRQYGGIFVAFLMGILVGKQQRRQQQQHEKTTTEKSYTLPSAKSDVVGSSVQRLEEMPLRPTSHNGISKRQFIEPFAIPRLSGYSVSTIQPGQGVEKHVHKTMHEFFYVTKGTGIFNIPGQGDVHVAPGTFLHIAPGELHSMRVPKDSSDGDLEMIYSGVTLD